MLNIYTHTYKYYTSCCNAVKSNKSIKTGCSTSQCSCETIWNKATTPIHTCHIFIGWAVPIKNKNTAERKFFPLIIGRINTCILLPYNSEKKCLRVLIMIEICFTKLHEMHFYVQACKKEKNNSKRKNFQIKQLSSYLLWSLWQNILKH